MDQNEIDKSAWEILEQIENEGAPNFTVELFEVFLTTSTQMMDELSYAFGMQDLKSISHLAHGLKSSCRQIGAMGVGRELELLEVRSRTSTQNIPVEVFTSIRARFEVVHKEISAECQRRRG